MQDKTLTSCGNQEFEVGIAEDSDFEVDGELGIQIVADATYTIKQSAGSVTLNIIDDDQPTGISIIAADKSIEEGTTARFQIVSHESVSVEREIHLKLVPRRDHSQILIIPIIHRREPCQRIKNEFGTI